MTSQHTDIVEPVEQETLGVRPARSRLSGIPGLGVLLRLLDRISGKLRTLNFSQWCYLIAVLMLAFATDNDNLDSENLYLVSIPAGIGLFREFWHLFSRIWDHMAGKGVVLVLYAATANFAVAVSAMKINEIAGVEPSPFVFTLGFTTLLMLPFWLVLATAVFFSLALIAVNLWLLLSIALRLIRIKIQVHWEDRSFVFITMILRVVLIPVVITSLGAFVQPYIEEIEFFENTIGMVETNEFTPEQVEQIRNAPKEDVQALIESFQREAEEKKAADESGARLGISFEDGEAQLHTNAEPSDNEDGRPVLDTLIASFIYWFETYPYSTCHKTAQQRSLIIDENHMLIVEKDDSELGYRFDVQACVPRYAPEESDGGGE